MNNNKKTLNAQDEINHEQGSFQRFEDKFLLTSTQSAELLKLLKMFLLNASPVPNTIYTKIESVYFDNQNLDILTEYLNHNSSRSKMRTRRYAPNGQWAEKSEYFIEVKMKENGISKKGRFQLTEEDKSVLSRGDILNCNNSLITLNNKIDKTKLLKRIERVNEFVKNRNTKPLCNITYNRQAYEKGNFRVTLDQDIQFELLGNINATTRKHIIDNTNWLSTLEAAQNNYRKTPFVLEVKHDGNIPDWMTKFISHNQIAEANFSKYCFAMSHLITGTSENSLIQSNSNLSAFEQGLALMKTQLA